MSESGVIPPPEERQRWVREMYDMDGDVSIEFSILPRGIVRLFVGQFVMADLDKDARDKFTRLWCEAGRQAEASSG